MVSVIISSSYHTDEGVHEWQEAIVKGKDAL